MIYWFGWLLIIFCVVVYLQDYHYQSFMLWSVFICWAFLRLCCLDYQTTPLLLYHFTFFACPPASPFLQGVTMLTSRLICCACEADDGGRWCWDVGCCYRLGRIKKNKKLRQHYVIARYYAQRLHLTCVWVYCPDIGTVKVINWVCYCSAWPAHTRDMCCSIESKIKFKNKNRYLTRSLSVFFAFFFSLFHTIATITRHCRLLVDNWLMATINVRRVESHRLTHRW